MNKNIFVVLMAGGVGTRFWPYSRNAKPKQFLDVLGTGKTLLQSTYERFLPLCPKENIFIVTNEELAGLTKTQLGLGDEQIWIEPMRKNTTACIALASQKIAKKSPNGVMIVSPADHLILNEAEFLKTISTSIEFAKDHDKLITLGITPTRPETGYGYIQYLNGESPLKKVKTFTEKPALELAKKFLDSGDFVWNSGIFIWSVQAILAALEKYQPEMAEVFAEAATRFYTEKEKQAIRTAYVQSKNISIDYGIMEKADNVYVWLSNFAWSDLGSWSSLYDIQKKDENRNVVDAHALIYNTRNSVIKGSKEKLMVVQGLDGYLVGEFDNVIIVCEKDKEELFRRFVNDLKTNPQGNDYL